MKQDFEMLEVSRSLGVAPSTASVIAGLLSGIVDPDHCRSIEFWYPSTFDAPPQPHKIMAAIAGLLCLKGEDIIEEEFVNGKEGLYLKYHPGQPTVIWTGTKFVLGTVNVK